MKADDTRWQYIYTYRRGSCIVTRCSDCVTSSNCRKSSSFLPPLSLCLVLPLYISLCLVPSHLRFWTLKTSVFIKNVPFQLAFFYRLASHVYIICTMAKRNSWRSYSKTFLFKCGIFFYDRNCRIVFLENSLHVFDSIKSTDVCAIKFHRIRAHVFS